MRERKASTLTLLRSEKGRDRKMWLNENMRNANPQELQRLNLDSFGQIMDGFIEQSKCGLAVTKEEGETEWTVHGSGCGAVMDFYIFLNALEPIYLEMLDQMGGEIDPEKLADVLSEEMRKCMLAAADDRRGKKDNAGQGEGH